MSVPRLSDSYPVVTLPRVAKVELEDRCVVSSVLSPDSPVIDLGISKSLIASYLIKPSPKLVWSYPLSPKTIVDAIDTSVVDDVKRYAVACHDGRNPKLMVLTQDEESSDVAEINLSGNAKRIKFSGNQIIIVYESGSVSGFKFINNTISEDANLNLKNSGTVKFCEFTTSNNQQLVVLVYQSKKVITYQVVAITPTQVYEVETKTVTATGDFTWCYGHDYIYEYNFQQKTISKISIAKFTQEKEISVAPLIAEGARPTIHTPCSDRLVLSSGSGIHVINFTYNAVLDSFQVKSSRSHPEADTVVVKEVVPIKGNGRQSKTVAVYLNLKPKDNNVDVNLISVDMGTNRLSECLGKAISKNKSEKFVGVIPILADDFVEQSKSMGAELDEVIVALEKCAAKKDVYKWERIIIPYLKNEPWSSIKKSISKTKSPKTKKEYSFQEMDEDTDRIVDIRFIKKVVGLVLKHREDGQVEFVDSEFFPEYTLMYLLTSPVFPVQYTTGLLQLFYGSGYFTPLRQAINTCPNLTVRELLIQVNNDVDDDIFIDLLARLCTNYSMAEITIAFKQLVVDYSQQISLDKLLVRLFGVPSNKNSLFLVEALIDVGGLFNWNDSTVDTLNEFIEGKIAVLMQNAFNLTLANQVMMASKPTKTKGKKKQHQKGQLSQVDSLLSMKNQSGLPHVQPIEISKNVPAYSVEKLAF